MLPKRPFRPTLGPYRNPEVQDLAARLSAWGTGVNGVLDALPGELEGLGSGPHHASHESGGSDAIKLDDLATPDDNTDLNATTGRHGLLRKLSGAATDVLDGTGAWNGGFDTRLTALENVSPIITQWSADAPPTGSAHAKSDEFTGSGGAAWDARWSEFDQSSELTPTQDGNGFGLMTCADQAGANRTVGMYQAVPAVAAYAFAVKISGLQPGDVAGLLQWGLFLSEDLGSAPTTADWQVIRTTQGSANNIHTSSFTAYNVGATNVTTQGRTDRDIYLRCRVTGTTTVAWDWASDGVGWHQMRTFTIAFTPVHMGIYMRNTSGGTAYLRVQWFRVVEATVGLSDLSPGGRVLNVFA